MKLSLPKLNVGQLDRLSEITGNLGIVFFATVITPLFTGDIDRVGTFVVGSGLILAFGCVSASLFLVKGKDVKS